MEVVVEDVVVLVEDAVEVVDSIDEVVVETAVVEVTVVVDAPPPLSTVAPMHRSQG